jgi:hypothetical protein
MTLRSAPGKAEASFDMNEVLLFNNILNEVCNAFAMADFELRMGATENHVRDLLNRIRTLGTDGPVCIQLAERELLILQNALHETLKELGHEEFSMRTGLSFEFGKAALKELQAWDSR